MTFLSPPTSAQVTVELEVANNQITRVIVGEVQKDDVLTIQKSGSERKNGILGTWSEENNKRVFEPFLPLNAGINYYLTVNGRTAHWFNLEAEATEAPRITAFYPTADTVPENLLKCSLRFSKPMREKDLYDHIQVRSQNGKVLDEVILPLEPALWNEDRTMLTMWIDPGRVKRGLKRNKRLGTPIEAGNTYLLHISGDWQSADGEPLGANWQKELVVSSRDENTPDPTTWQITSPTNGTAESLKIAFPENMDYLTTVTGIEVFYGAQKVEGEVTMTKDEKVWQFTPEKTWQAGTYNIVLDPAIEDLAGNNLKRPFDRDLTKMPIDTGAVITTLQMTIANQ